MKFEIIAQEQEEIVEQRILLLRKIVLEVMAIQAERYR